MLIRCESWTCAIDSLNMGLNYYASSPILLPHAAQPSHLPMGGQSHGAVLEPAFNLQAAPAAGRRRPARLPVPPPPGHRARPSDHIAGRKRSRDDDNGGADGDRDELEACSRAPAGPESVPGPGMTLVYPDRPHAGISPESQSGAWLEDAGGAPRRPQPVSRKSIRLGGDGDTAQSVDDVEALDPVVRRLGIGWRRVCAAGSETFVRREFDMCNPRVLLHHEGLAVYVVCSEPLSAPGYWQQFWLFREDLRSCRFLCRDEGDLFARIGNKRLDERGIWVPDIVCEGPERFARCVGGPGGLPENSPTNSIFGAGEQTLLAQDVEMVG